VERAPIQAQSLAPQLDCRCSRTNLCETSFGRGHWLFSGWFAMVSAYRPDFAPFFDDY
jgi:hypothetical protein